MKIYIAALVAALIQTIQAHIPSLSEMAHAVAYLDWDTTDFAQLWLDLKGDALTASAVATGDRDHILAAMLLGGTVIATGLTLPVATNGLSSLCEIIVSDNDFWSEQTFQMKKRKLLSQEGISSSDHRKRWQYEFESLSFMTLPYVCGNELPLSVKVVVLKARVLSHAIDAKASLQLGHTQSKQPPLALNQSFNELLQAEKNRKQGEMGLLRAVQYELFYPLDDVTRESRVSSWLYGIIGEMLASEFFIFTSKGVFELVQLNDASLAHCHIVIGELLALALTNSVTIPVPFDSAILKSLLLSNGRMYELSMELEGLRQGFHGAMSSYSIEGNYMNRQQLINEQELSDIFRKKF